MHGGERIEIDFGPATDNSQLGYLLPRTTLATSDPFWLGGVSLACIFRFMNTNSFQISLFVYTSLTIWNIPVGLKWTCYLLAGCLGGISGLLYAWTHEICSDDNEERALVTGSINEAAYIVQAWLPLLIWQQTEAPQYRKGMSTSIGIYCALITTTLVVKLLHDREIAAKKRLMDVGT